jgi:hypothetical protein
MLEILSLVVVVVVDDDEEEAMLLSHIIEYFDEKSANL